MINLILPGILVASTFLGELLRRRPKNPRNLANLDEFDVPTIEVGRVLPQIYGTVRVDSPSLTWYGDLKSREVRDEGYPVGYRYYMGAQLVFCAGPNVEIVKFLYDGKERPFTAQDFADFQFLTIDMKGTRETKGMPTVEVGYAYFYPGWAAQQPPGYLVGKIPGWVPGYRGICHLLLQQLYIGDSTSAKSVGAVLRRLPNGLGVPHNKHRIGDDCNPACLLFDRLTAPRIPYGGAGISPSRIDVTGLLAMAETLYAEGLGVSYNFRERQSVAEQIDEVLSTINAVRYRDPATGLETFRLVRQGYPPPPVYGPGRLREFKRTPVSMGQQPTTVRVSYTDANAGYQGGLVQIHNDAAIEYRGGDVVPQELEARGITTAANAMKVAAAFAAVVTNPIMACSGFLDRSAWALRPGDVIQVDWPADGFTGLRIRVSKVRLPAPASNPAGEVYFEGAEDQFGVDSVVYAEPPPSVWEPTSGPGALAGLRVVEAPPRLFGIDRTQSGHGALVLASRGSGSQDGYNALLLDDDGTFRTATQTGAFCPRGLLIEDVTETTDLFRVSAPLDVDLLRTMTLGETVAGGSVLMIGDELVSYRTLRDNADGTVDVYGVARGVVDTFPAPHAAGAPVLFLSAGRSLIELPGPVGSATFRTSSVKAQPYNQAGVLAIDSCPLATVTVGNTPRARLPGPPTRILINGQEYPDSVNGKLTLLWHHRNRLAVSSFAEANETFTAEPGTTYTVEVYGQASTLIRRETGISNQYWEYSVVQELIDSGLQLPNTTLRVRVWSVRDGAASWQAFNWTFGRVYP